MYVRALAWWQAAPEPKADPHSKAKPPKAVTRAQAAEDKGQDAALPRVEPEALYLVETLMDAGPVLHGGMGPTPLTWEALGAWQHGTGIELDPWEARTVLRLSTAYLAESRRAEDIEAVPPWLTPDEGEDFRLSEMAKKTRERMRALAQM